VKNLAIVVATIIFGGMNIMSDAEAATTPITVAHRGGNEAHTEDTNWAYSYALAHGVTDLETDVQWDKTGRPVIMHDDTIDRTTNGTGKVTSIDFVTSTVKMNDGAKLADQTLDKLLAQLHTKHATSLGLELKGVIGSGTTATNHLKPVHDLLVKYDMLDKVIINSFNWGRVGAWHTRYGTESKLAYVCDSVSGLPSIEDVQAAHVTALYVPTYLISESIVAAYKAAGIGMYVWTLDNATQWESVDGWALAGVVTNKPLSYNAWRAG
jgi:glycerophosphoryl diester phosphodiesterase